MEAETAEAKAAKMRKAEALIAPVEATDKARAVAPTPLLSSGEVLYFSPVPSSQIEPSPLVNPATSTFRIQ
jgi:hypothetical protein